MKRSLAFYAFLLAAPALGAGLAGPRAAPIQLSFAFAAPVASSVLSAPAPEALTAAPDVPSAVPALARAAAMPPSVPEPAPKAARRGDDEDGRGQLRRLAGEAGGAGASFDAAPRATKIDYETFGRQIASRPGLDLNPFRHADAKRRILAASGYTHLRGAGGSRVPLADASDVRVGKAFAGVKRAFDRRPSRPKK